ncbi:MULTISPECIES: GNAT family N-acetyltransferase [Microbacterium]|uniref:N-acetyltransferase domain-containing protein n=1 Tax=Microbacterium barkeri TaxID=33917 RepID=A0A9W6H4I3_9MICO|nr:GNAT family N-acetyltransferase [Microbacterium barkeri]MDI6944013.1 GNAT family N-acetyltransferase [Microbacterium barkeri]MDR6876389.1 GNAT superfamily N-acetyltransferase [Microbacterium barkeri]GLJ62015.1 hypothetical protein GCM10017576_21450 [Microbacterium barkeri]
MVVSEANSLVLHKLATSDRQEFVTRLQGSFDVGAAAYFDNDSSDPVISEAEIYQSMDHPGADTWDVREGGNGVGGAVVSIKEGGLAASLDLLFIDAGEHGRGLGSELWAAIEAHYPGVRVWKTMTPYDDTRNIHFYVNKCGFRIVEFFHPGHPDPHDTSPAAGAEERSIPDLMFAFEKNRSPLM